MTANQRRSGKRLEHIIQKGVTLVDFTAPWCAPCRIQGPIIKQLARKYKRTAQVVNLNVDDHRPLAMRFGITSIPTLVIFKNGVEIQRFVGLQSVEALSEAIEKALV